MTFRDQLFEAAKPFLMKEGIESSKEIIANNSTSFDEMGMANANPGEFAPEEITDQENLVNTAKMANDNDFNSEAPEAEVTVVSILGDDAATNAGQALEDLVRLGGEECPECEDEPEHNIGDIIESILRKKDKALLESLGEAREVHWTKDQLVHRINYVMNDPSLTSSEKNYVISTILKVAEDLGMDLSDEFPELCGVRESSLDEENLEEIVNYWPGFTDDKPDKGKYATHLASRLRNSINDITSGKTAIPDDVRKNFADKDLVADWKQYNNSNRGDPEYRKAVIAAAVELAPGNEEAQKELIHNPSEEMCANVAARLNKKLGNAAIEFNLVPGEDLLDKFSQNYQAGRRAFTNAFLNSFDGRWQQDVLGKFHNFLNGNTNAPAPVEEPAAPAMSKRDAALLQKAGISLDNPEAEKILAILKGGFKAPAGRKKAMESVLAESDYAGNLSYNPDKRLNASDVLNAVKNAVKPELAPALSIVKNVDANEEPSYAIQNIDEKDLPATLEIDTNTDEKVVLKKDGNSYKFDK